MSQHTVSTRRDAYPIVKMDKRGDLILTVSKTEDSAVSKGFMVCSRTMARASKYFRILLYGEFAEARGRITAEGDKAKPWVVDLFEDDPEAFEILARIIHGKKEPFKFQDPDLGKKFYLINKFNTLMLNIIIVADKYLLTRHLFHFRARWDDTALPRTTKLLSVMFYYAFHCRLKKGELIFERDGASSWSANSVADSDSDSAERASQSKDATDCEPSDGTSDSKTSIYPKPLKEELDFLPEAWIHDIFTIRREECIKRLSFLSELLGFATFGPICANSNEIKACKCKPKALAIIEKVLKKYHMLPLPKLSAVQGFVHGLNVVVSEIKDEIESEAQGAQRHERYLGHYQSLVLRRSGPWPDRDWRSSFIELRSGTNHDESHWMEILKVAQSKRALTLGKPKPGSEPEPESESE